MNKLNKAEEKLEQAKELIAEANRLLDGGFERRQEVYCVDYSCLCKEPKDVYRYKFDVNRIIEEENDGWVADNRDFEQKKGEIVYDHKHNKMYYFEYCLFERPSVLKPCNPEAFESILSRITQEQIDAIWRLK